MNEIYRLNNTVKHYAWGSSEWIPRLTGQENPSGEPWAELWMGVHPQGPSTVTSRRKTFPLSDLTKLPFLLKFLAAESPLSIQAHPNLAQAQEGFERENKAGIALCAPERNYRDPNHKPEILCALSPFSVMAGFREPEETEKMLLVVPGTEKLRDALSGGYRAFLSVLYEIEGDKWKSLNATILQASKRSGLPAPLRLCGEFAKRYPNDPGILAPLYLNMLELKPYEALFIPAGILHSYVHGFALECMSNSDNVLRGGLTHKHIDTEELFSILSFEPFKPELLKPTLASPCCYDYKTPCGEFSLYLIKNIPHGSAVELEERGDAIITVFEGAAKCFSVEERNTGKKRRTKRKAVRIKRGESFFAGQREPGERLAFTGDFTLFAAAAPEPHDGLPAADCQRQGVWTVNENSGGC